jgi:signal peptidase I
MMDGLRNLSPHMKGVIRDIIITVLIAAVVYLGLRTVVQSFRVDGPSMLPNFETGQWVLVNKLVYRVHPPERGDVIVFRSPHNRESNLIKRVTGLPGESVELRDGTVYIRRTDGEVVALAEPYIPNPDTRPFTGGTIPEGQIFVLGDNRRVTDDSRFGWLVPEGDIIGKAWLSTWPPSDWGLAANRRPVEQPVS